MEMIFGMFLIYGIGLIIGLVVFMAALWGFIEFLGVAIYHAGIGIKKFMNKRKIEKKYFRVY